MLRSERLPAVALAAAMVFASVVLYRQGLGLTFFYDEWNFVMNRRDWTVGTFLEPHNEHLVLVPVILFKALFLAVGLDDYWAYRVVVLGLHLVCVVLVFALARRRLDPYPALAAALAVLVLGSAWQNLLWPFQSGYLASVAAGLGMLLALDVRRDVLATVLLAVALASGSIGLPFAAAALVEVAWRPGNRRRRLSIPLVPLALYALWSVVYGNPRAAPGAENGLRPLVTQNIPSVPGYVADAAAGAFGAVIGLGIEWGRPLALVALVALAVRLARRPVGVRLASLLAAGAVYWGLAALFRAQLNAPAESRYLYFGAIVVVLVAVEAMLGVRRPPRAGRVIAVVLALSAIANFGALRDGSRSLRETSAYVAAELGALEVAGPDVDPNYRPDPTRAPDITAGRYFDAVEDYGSPADTPADIAARAEPYRQSADTVLIQALGIVPQPTTETGRGTRPVVEAAVNGETTLRRSCVRFAPTGPGATLDVGVPPGGITVTTRGTAAVELRLRAFAASFPAAALAALPGRSTHRVAPPWRSEAPGWRLRLTPPDPVEACGLT